MRKDSFYQNDNFQGTSQKYSLHFINKVSNHVDTGGHVMAFFSVIHVQPGQAPQVHIFGSPTPMAPGFKLGALKLQKENQKGVGVAKRSL